MNHAFPEDELKPLSCKPQTRNKDNIADIGLNDVLGNYSVTLVDSLSTLAILASGDDGNDGQSPLKDFQAGVQALVELYGDGGERRPCGTKACGFDLDSKVQVFETNIRGVGGLLSAHLFAIGELPIRGYEPGPVTQDDEIAIDWDGWIYDGQLLRLAYDLASRLLPAFNTPTGLPYPRVNLRHGIPFYRNSQAGVCRVDGTSSDPREITETCAAGAGSLILEFTTLSRLTGDERFETLAKKAFWAVWDRRSGIGLIGNGIDAENGQWTSPPLAGIGAGVDSFFEYAVKSSILLSGLPYDPATEADNAPEAFLQAWNEAHSAVKHHVLRPLSDKHPFYGQADLVTGAPRYSWIDNLSAYYPGLLTLVGELDEAIEGHLLWAALWTRYAALPERWHTQNAFIDPNFRHWAGRPEFIESTYYLYQATKDPFYLHVGEMALRDIRRRCWTPCGWADLGDVISGEQRDRMESFFLGETAKYLYLLFEDNHPLNLMDAPVVFTTEGHPMIVPSRLRRTGAFKSPRATRTRRSEEQQPAVSEAKCPAFKSSRPLVGSSIVDRPDFFHAAAMAQLHLVPVEALRSSSLHEAAIDSPGISMEDIRSPTNYTYYPWTLPQNLVPSHGYSAEISSPILSTLTFPNLNSGKAGEDKGLLPLGALQKVMDGVVISSLSNMRLSMVQEPRSLLLPDGQGVMVEMEVGQQYRVHGIANWPLGKDEKVLLAKEAMEGVAPGDPNFKRMKDLEFIDLVIDYRPVPSAATPPSSSPDQNSGGAIPDEFEVEIPENGTLESIWDEIETMFTKLLSGEPAPHHPAITPLTKTHEPPLLSRTTISAILPTGAGAASLPAQLDTLDPTTLATGSLPNTKLYFLDSTLCSHRLPIAVVKSHQILVIRRGECSFNEKLANIPAFTPSREGLQLVVVVSSSSENGSGSGGGGEHLIRPLLDERQKTPAGIERRHAIAMAMVEGSGDVVAALRGAASVFAYVGDDGLLKEEELGDVAEMGGSGQKAVLGGSGKEGGAGGGGSSKASTTTTTTTAMMPGLGVKRRYWFESMGVPIGNLIVL
jgi:hypothetical protein